jgi:hypothetical protein
MGGDGDGDGCGDAMSFDADRIANSGAGWQPGQEPSTTPTHRLLEANGAPIVEQSHEYVIKKPEQNA